MATWTFSSPGVGARPEHLDDAEAHADRDGPAKQPADLLRPGVGGDVVVLGGQAEQLVAHAAAGPEGLVAGLAQAAARRRWRISFVGHGPPVGLEPRASAALTQISRCVAPVVALVPLFAQRQLRRATTPSFGLQHQHRAGVDLPLQVGDQLHEIVRAALEVGEGRTQEEVDGFVRGLPVLAPAVGVGPHDATGVGDAERFHVVLDLAGQAEVAFDEFAARRRG